MPKKMPKMALRLYEIDPGPCMFNCFVGLGACRGCIPKPKANMK